MKPFWKIALAVICVAAISGAAITWQLHERKLKEAARVCRASAEHGDAEAQHKLGSMYFYGEGVPKDYAEALRWYRKSADQGNAGGQNALGYLYFHSKGVQQDLAEADRWYQKAADQGFAKAQFKLGYSYYHGYGVQQDNAQAASWYRKAAEQGYALAESGIGFMYYYGYGVPQDRAEANRWFHKAADQGDHYAQRTLGLRGPGFKTCYMIGYSIMFLGCLAILIGSLSQGWRHQTSNNRSLTLASLLGLTILGLSLYRDFGIFPSVLVANAFLFVKDVLAGIFVAMLIHLVFPKMMKIALGIFGLSFICLDLLFIAIYYSKHLFLIRPFCAINGMFLGVSVSLAIFLWRAHKNAGKEPDSDCEDAASEAPSE